MIFDVALNFKATKMNSLEEVDMALLLPHPSFNSMPITFVAWVI